ncbi:energy transducer TonB [Tichowtungia aerotolerans]|uniref:TonB family protein n=1 Tax=Tichowtungia aerotolerans TaxID=2697043 RepID=A0A6P1MAC4_9BACT|nr:energy transducer TonB [Tichowtungia aerotolerans]QHI70043.1 TonB family protein [Tichowtungia aerotolerans]
MKFSKPDTVFSRFRHHLWTALGAIGLTLIFFLVLPLMQTITQPRDMEVELQSVDGVVEPPPPPPPEPEQEKKQEEEPPPPELSEEAPPLDLSQLELALNPGFSEGWMGGDFAVQLNTVVSKNHDLNSVFSMADLDQKPRVIYQPGPTFTKQVRRKAPGTVYIIFVVDQRGRVINPAVQKSTDPVFTKPALAAVKQWKFEPGKRNGKAVRFRMRVPITFPKG